MKVLVDKDFLEEGLELICDSIRLKTGGTGVLAFPVEMAAAVETIEGSGGITPEGKKEITENGDDIDVTTYAAVKVAVPIPSPPSGTLPITANGTGIDVTQYAAVDVDVQPSGSLTITENGTGIDVAQYAEVDVAVPAAGYDEVVHRRSGDIVTANTNKSISFEIDIPKENELVGIYLEKRNVPGVWDIFTLLVMKDENGSWRADGCGNTTSGPYSISFDPIVNISSVEQLVFEEYTIVISLNDSSNYVLSTEAQGYRAKAIMMRKS